MRSGNNKIRVSKIYKRFILSFMIVLLLPVSCFTFLFLQNYREIYREKVLDLAKNSLEASIMELERTIESLESFVSYNLMADSISEIVLLKDYGAEEISNILSAELIAQPILDSISYYNAIKPDTIYVENGTYELKYYARSYISMESEKALYEELNNPEHTGWMVWDKVGATQKDKEPALTYVVKTWKNECWIFWLSGKKLEEIINSEKTTTILQSSDGTRLYPLKMAEDTDGMDTINFIGDEEGYCEISVSSSDGRFMLTRYIDEVYLFAEVNAWQKYFFATFLAVLLAGGVLILVLTTFNEHPIRKLYRDWRKKIPNMPENVIGLEALQFAMKSMEEQVTIMETKQKKNQLLLQLIYGKDCETTYFQNRLKEAGLFQHAEVYRVMIAVCEAEQENSINKLGVYLDMFMEEDYEFRAIGMTGADASIIIAGMTKNSEKGLESKLQQIVDAMEQNINQKMFIYVGGKYEEKKKIHVSYSQALSCSQNKEREENISDKRVIYYKPVRKNTGKFRYPSEELNTLYTALVETNLDKASEVTEKLVEILKEQSDNRFVSVSLYYDVLNVYYGAQAKLDLDIDATPLEVDLLEIQEHLDVVQMILRIRDQFQSYIDCIKEKDSQRGNISVSKKKAGKTSPKEASKEPSDNEEKDAHIISRVLQFIDENSRSCDLSVSMISYHFDMSISNLSHQFKAQTNRTISDYVTEKKFAYARELLLTTDYSVQKIASMTGYSQPASFIRKFRQYYGMTPMEYRNASAENIEHEEKI